MARSGYQSPFDLPDPLTGAGPSWELWADQLDPTQSRYDPWANWAQPEQYAYGREPTQQVEFDPFPTGESYSPPSVTFGSSFVDSGIESWLREQFPELYNFPQNPGGNNPGQMGSPNTPKWNPVNQWDAQISAAAQQVADELGVYVPLNVIKSIMQIETGGVMPGSPNEAGAVGLMQVTGSTMGQYDLARANSDPAYSIYAGTKELALRYQDAQRQNKDFTWDNAAVGFFSGHYEPTGADDGYNTDFNYLQMFRANQTELGQATGPAGSGQVAPGSSNPQTTNQVLTEAQKFVGVPYVWGGVPGKGVDPWSIPGWDCSGFTYWLDQNYGSGNLPMGSHYQYQYAKDNGMLYTGTGQMQAGDAIFFDTGDRSGGGGNLNAASHVAIYLGGGKMMHAANESVGTIISDVSDYVGRYGFLGGMHMGWSGGQAVQPNNQFKSIWGGFDAPITQEMGMGADIAQGGYYDNYDYTLGIDGHPGLDVGIASGTRLFSPVSGTVTANGGTGYYTDTNYGDYAPQTGEFRLELDNGDILILGHMSQITVKVGDRITPGQFVGLSGYNNGDHVHVEYRQKHAHQYGTHIAIDPREALGGSFGGAYHGAGEGVFAPGNVNDWNSFMKSAAMNLPIRQTPMIGGFGDWLRAQMGVGPSTSYVSGGAPTGWSWKNPTTPANPPNATGPGGTGT